MRINTLKLSAGVLPIKRSLTLEYAISIVIAVIMIVASIVGILHRSVIYPTEKLSVGFVSTDLLNLAVGVPVLLVSMWLVRRGQLIGLLCWPGAGLLLMCSMLFIGVIPAMVFQALSVDAPIDVIGILVVLISGMVCFIPFVLFVRGAAKTRIL